MLRLLAVPFVFFVTIAFYYIYSGHSANEKIEEYNQKIVVYSDEKCSYCIKAARFLKSQNFPFDIIDLSDNLTLRQSLASKTGAYTVPYIFVNENYIGGYDDMIKLFKSGTLEQMLK